MNWEDVPENTCCGAKNMVNSYHRSNRFRTAFLKCPQCQVPRWAELGTGGSDLTPSSLRIRSGEQSDLRIYSHCYHAGAGEMP